MEELKDLLSASRFPVFSITRRDESLRKHAPGIALEEFYINGHEDFIATTDFTRAVEAFKIALSERIGNIPNPIPLITTCEIDIKEKLRSVEETKKEYIDGQYTVRVDFESTVAFISDEGKETIDKLKYSDLDKNSKGEVDAYFYHIITGLNKLLLLLAEHKKMAESGAVNFDKILLDFTVDEIVLFFRLLHENKKIKTESKEDLYRKISMVFQSKSSDEISPNSLRKKYNDFNEKAIPEIDALLVNMRSTLKNIQENLGK